MSKQVDTQLRTQVHNSTGYAHLSVWNVLPEFVKEDHEEEQVDDEDEEGGGLEGGAEAGPEPELQLRRAGELPARGGWNSECGNGND